MSCKMSSCESDVEPVTRLKDAGRPKPPKIPASRHIVNPNFMFFCQIVLLIIPVTVLFAGLYFMNISSPLIVLICGAIIFVVLCIFVFVRPFKEEKCEEKKPLRRSYEYSPIKLTADADPVRSERPKLDKRHILHRDGDDDEEEDEEECPSQTKNESTDTLLSIGTSDFSEIATQTRTEAEVSMAGVATPADRRCRCCQMGCRGPIRENEAALQETLKQSKQTLPITMEDINRCTWETKGYSTQADQVSPPNSLGVIEGGDSTRPESVLSPSPCSEEMYHTAKLLIPDVALSDTTNPSRPTTNHTMNSLSNNTPFSGKFHHPNQRQAFDGKTVTVSGYTSPESSATGNNRRVKSPPNSPRTTKTIEQQTFTERHSYGSGQSNVENFRNKSGRSSDVTSASRLCQFEFRSGDNFISHHNPPISTTSTNLPQKVGHQFPKCHRQGVIHTTNAPVKDKIIQPIEASCTNRLCQYIPKNQPQVDSKVTSPPNSSFGNHPLKATLEKPLKSKKKKGFVEENENEEGKLTAPGRQNIFLSDSRNEYPRKSVKEPEFQAVKFQICPNEKTITKDQCSSTDHHGTKQPILIKLFPTSSKDGVFSWEANPVKPTGVENTSAGNMQTASMLQEDRTVDECVQTTAPEMIDTQTSAVFSRKEQSVRYSVPDVKDSRAARGSPMHQTASGSMVDFVLRPFSKVVKSVTKTTGDKKLQTDKTKSRKRSKQDRQRQEITETNNDSSKFDLLKIQSPSKKENHRASENQREEENKLKGPNKEKSPRQEIKAKLDICSIYYSSIQGKLYQPTRSGLLVTESSKEEVDKPQNAVKWPPIGNVEAGEEPSKCKAKASSPHHRKRVKYDLGTTQKQPATTEHEVGTETKRVLTRNKRKSDDERESNPKCARHDGRKSKHLVSTETSLPRQKETGNVEKTRTHRDSERSDEIKFMFNPLNLDFSSGPCDEDSKLSSSNLQFAEKSACRKPSPDYRVSKKPQSPRNPHGSKSKNQKTSHRVETKVLKKSSSYENVVIEKVTKQKKRTLKKYK